jgi:Ca-activated chloride channel homolog
MDITFGNIELLWILLAIPVMFGLFAVVRLYRRKQIAKLGKAEITKTLILENSNFRPWAKFSFLMLALSLLLFALSRPQFVTETKVDASEGNEIIIALDISNSMLASADNLSFSRLEMAKNAIFKFIDNLNNEKLGLVVFAGQAVMQIPITQDYSAFEVILKSISPSYISAQGTSIGDAIDLATSSFTPDDNHQKILILISDGEDHEGNIDEFIKKASQNNVKIYTVGIGSTRGNPVYIDGEILKDKKGEIVMSKLNETILRQIAKDTEGEYLNFDNKAQNLKKIYDKMGKTDSDGKTSIAKYDEKYYYFVFPAFLLLLFEFFILMRKNKWLQRLNIFKK